MHAAPQPAPQSPKSSCGCKASKAEPCRCSVKAVPNVLGSAGSLARRSSGGAARAGVPASVGAVLRAPGVPLPPSLRSDFETRFAHDFSRVRVHADATAARSARHAGALAYTVGHHIAFADGQYSPSSARGRDTLAHELAHVVQQRAVPDGHIPHRFSAAGEEHEADRHASAALEGRGFATPPARPASLARRLVHEGTWSHPPDRDVRVRRVIEEGRCTWHDERATAGDIDLQHAWLSFTVCSGSTRASGGIDVQYGQAVAQAMQAINTFLSNPLAPGAGNTLRSNLQAIGPSTSAYFELSMGPVLAAVTGFAQVDLGGRVRGSVGPSVRVPVGQDELEIGAVISGGTGQPTTGMGLLTWRFGGARTSENCGKCECTKPDITTTCTELPPRTEPAPPPQPQPVSIPIQFEYARTTPLAGTDARLAQIISYLEQGYTVSRIVGNASPEGDELVVPPPAADDAFHGNIPLSQARADTARQLVEAAVQRQLSGGRASILRPDHPSLRNLRNAFSGNPPAVGTGELFGRSDTGEVPRAALFRHLTTVLRVPPGQRDPLETAGVLGGNLPPDIDAASRAEVEAFRTGRRGTSRLSHRQRLRALYPLLRRALVELAPPLPRVPMGDELAAEVRRQWAAEEARVASGRVIPCEARHLDSLPSLRTLRLHTGDCGPATAPLDDASRSGQTAP